jgi:hypothetical protein
MTSWSDIHGRSEGLAQEAHAALAAGQESQARALFLKAADEERAALHLLGEDKPRTYGITAVSAVALYYKAGAADSALGLAEDCLARTSLPAFAARELRELLLAIEEAATPQPEAPSATVTVLADHRPPPQPASASPQVLQFARNLRDKLPRTADLAAAMAEERATITSYGAWNDRTGLDLEAAAALIRREYEFVLMQKLSIKTPRPEWYTGPRIGDRHWPALRSYLIEKKGWEEDTTVASIHASSGEVVSLLENPAKARFLCRGLVVGYVQSGKTANMTAVIAKAVDSGYNFIVVLAGVTDKLRQQTQRRLEADLVKRHPADWTLLTNTEREGEFKKPPQGHLQPSSRFQLSVMKKNIAPLQRLLECIEKTPAAEMSKIRILLIDDECDQAGVNSASSEANITGINLRIRQILKAAPAISYAGYTATPFANILINPYAEETEDLDDLYPADFITALPLPQGYFGTEAIFGRPPKDPSDPQPDEDGLDMVRPVPEEDEALLQPSSRKDRDGFSPGMPDSLRDAILYFIATCAARRARGQAGDHMTMLVHTSAYVRMHEAIAEMISAWTRSNAGPIAKVTGPIGARARELWDREARRLPPDITQEAPVSFEQLSPHLADVMKALSVPVENGSSDDRIDYTGEPMTYIVVGGSILARGLTLDGLVVSYFLRSSNQYDTLLQMGRWFGFREGYEDLQRLWMPREMQLRFRALAAIEAEIREEMSGYSRAPSITPMDVAVRIRRIPGMAIVSRNRMRHAGRAEIGFWGRHVQTIRFPRREKNVLSANWQAGSQLLSSAASQGKLGTIPGRILYNDVPRQAVTSFLRSYVIDASHQDLQSDLLLAFIDKYADQLRLWNVGVVQPEAGAPAEVPLGPISAPRLMRRSVLKSSTPTIADIKALMSRADVAFDCDPARVDVTLNWEPLKVERRTVAGDRPLLLLYPIDRASEPRDGSTSREALDAPYDVLGFGLIFPGSREYSGNYLAVELRPLSAEELEEEAVAEAEMLEAADVA